MNNEFNNQYRMFKGLQRYCVRNNNDLNFPEFQTEVADLNSNLTKWDKTIIIQQRSVIGITNDTMDLVKLMCETCDMFAHKCRPLARKIGNKTILDLLSGELTPLLKSRFSNAIARCTEIKDTIDANQALFTNIVPADITLMTNQIQAASDSIANTKSEIAHKKGAGTEIIPLIIADLEVTKDNMFDYVLGYFKTTKIHLLKEFNAITNIANIGKHYTGLVMECYDGNPAVSDITDRLMNVNVAVTEQPKKKAVSDIDGIANIKTIKHGKYHVTFTLAGYKPLTLIVDFKKGKTLHILVQMDKI